MGRSAWSRFRKDHFAHVGPLGGFHGFLDLAGAVGISLAQGRDHVFLDLAHGGVMRLLEHGGVERLVQQGLGGGFA